MQRRRRWLGGLACDLGPVGIEPDHGGRCDVEASGIKRCGLARRAGVRRQPLVAGRPG